MVAPRGNRAEKARWVKDQPKVSTPDSQQYPVFCLRHIVREEAFSLEARSEEQKAALVDQLRLLSQLSWAQIYSSHRHGAGCEKIPQKQLKFRLPVHVSPDVSILAFRFKGKAPMLGYRDEATFHIICLDPDFCAYDH